VTSSTTATSGAAGALLLVRADPLRARAEAEEALAAALAAADGEEASIAERVLGLAAREANDLAASATHLRSAIRMAERAGFPSRAAEARMSLAGTLQMMGRGADALREADRAAPDLHGVDRARLLVQRGTVLMELGRLDEALVDYERALPVLRRGGDGLWEARLLVNRGLVWWHRGSMTAAEADIATAERLYAELGQHRSVAQARRNLGLVACLRGDIPTALTRFDDADRYFARLGRTEATVESDRCQVLLDARLLAEARDCARRAADELTRDGRVGYAAIARLHLAEAFLATGDADTARDVAEEARRAFGRQGRTSWAALARHVSLQAAWSTGERSSALLTAARRTAAALEQAGFAVPALDARLLAAQLAAELGQRTVALRELHRARKARDRGPAALRARAWHAEALLRLACGNRRGAKSALRAGVRLLERNQASLGATELRVRAAGHAADLAALGMRLAFEDRDARCVLGWAERWRAGALRLAPVRPPVDTGLAADLAALRSVVAEIDTAALAGKPTSRLHARQVDLEDAVRESARRATGILAASVEPPPSVAALIDALGDRALVEIVDHEGALHAVVVAGGRVTLRSLAATAEVATELDHLLFSLRRSALGRGSQSARSAAAAASCFAARRLDDLLLRPVADEIGNRPLVVVPTGVLHALPWAALPSCRRRPVTVAPSAASWYRASLSAGAGTGSVVLVGGPGLAGATAEITALAGRYTGCQVMWGEEATVDATCAALDGASLAHVASHGTFRADNPLFSCLHLADGPLTVYDLEGLQQAPKVLILSACESGLSDVCAGDELMGLAAAVLAMGTVTLVASVYPVSDKDTRELMLDFHGGLRDGVSPAAALAHAQGARQEGSADVAFVCFGFG
jgi:tetratricopeptide (TPR) repeat protein